MPPKKVVEKKKYNPPEHAVVDISRPGIRRLAFRAGIKTISNLVFDQVRTLMIERLTFVLNKSIVYTLEARRKTVSLGDVLNGLEDGRSRVAFGSVDTKGRPYVPPSHINFIRYSHSVMKYCHPDTGITGKAASQINAIIFYIGKDLANRITKITLQSGRATITSEVIRTAVQSIFPAELAKHAFSFGEKSVEKFTHSIETKSEGVKTTKASRAELQFPPDRVKRFFKGATSDQKFLGHTSLKTSDSAMVYLSAVLEYIVAEIMKLSGSAAKDNKLQRITNRHIFLAIANDEELVKLMKNVGIRLGASGVLSDIHPSLLETSGKKTVKARSNGVHRFRPGTVSLRLIRRYQKSNETLLQREPFKRLVRVIADNHESSFKFSAGAFDVLLDDLESFIVKTFQSANRIAIHRGAVTVMSRDFEMVRFFENG